MATFPEKVKHARSELGLTQAELGEATGVSLRTILDYEKGKKVRILPGTATSRRPAKATVQRAAVKSTPCSVKA